MQHKFASLIELRKVWNSLDTDGLLSVLKALLEIDVIDSYKNAIISGIFQQIYDEGESNDDMFFAHLLTSSYNALSQQQAQSTNVKNSRQSNQDKFEQLADGILCNIASYLSCKNVFTKWTHVNRKFLQIGLKPQSIKHFKIGINKHPPKFKFDVTLSKLESLHHEQENNCKHMRSIVTNLSTKHLRSLTIGMLFVIY